MYRIHQIKLGLNESKNQIPAKIKKKLGIRDLKINQWRIAKESIDARDKANIKWIYSVDFQCNKKLKLEEAPCEEYIMPEISKLPDERPVVIGQF